MNRSRSLLAILGLLALPIASAPGAAEPPVLRGKAVFLRPLDSARLTIFALDDRPALRKLQTARLDRLHNGIFAVPLNTAVERALAAGRDLRLMVDGRQPTDTQDPPFHRVRLAADLHEFDPVRQVVRVDLYTTLVSTYRRSHHGMTFEEARANVHDALGAPDTALCAPAFSTAHFDPRLFTTRAIALFGEQISATSAIARLNRVLVAAIDNGESLGLGRGRPDLPGDAGTDLAEELAISLLKAGASKAGNEAVGWVIDTVFGAPDATAEELAEIESQLTVISQQLTQISEQLDALSQQLAEAEAAIINEVDYQAYQARASALQKEINQLCNIENQLILLSESDPTENNSAYIATLAANIQDTVDPILRDLQSELLGSQGVVGLIDFWAQLNGAGTGYPTFFSNLYLTNAAVNLNYYISAQVLALNLLSELGHYEIGQGSASVGQGTVNSALRLYFGGVDQQIIQLAARKALPDGSYPSLVLASDDVTVDSRSGLMWQRTNFCTDPYYPPDPNAATIVGTFPPPLGSYLCLWEFPDVRPAVASFTLDGLSGWRLPTGAEAQALYSARGSKQPWDYLYSQGIYVPTDNRDGITDETYWTTDPCPNGFNCVFYLRSGGGVGNTPFNPYWGIYDDYAYAIALRSLTPSETYRAICDANGQNCVVPCGPDDDPDSEMCPVPSSP